MAALGERGRRETRGSHLASWGKTYTMKSPTTWSSMNGIIPR